MLLDNSSRSNDDEEELYTIIEVSIIMAHECIYSDSDTSGSTRKLGGSYNPFNPNNIK